MSNVEVNVIVEGQTEQIFLRDVLAPYMADKGIYLHPALIGRPGHKGGNIHFERAKNDIGNFLKQRTDTYVTTMFDYFKIDTQWPGKDEIEKQKKKGITLTATQKAKILEKATDNKIRELYAKSNAENRFISYIEMHDFEALLFSNIKILAEQTGIDESQIKAILQEYNDPEEINEKEAPSKRLNTLKNGYRKTAYGKIISEAIGIQTIREKYTHFNNWLTILEDL